MASHLSGVFPLALAWVGVGAAMQFHHVDERDLGSLRPWLCLSLCVALSWCVDLWLSAGCVLFAHEILYATMWAGCMGHMHILCQQPACEGGGW